MNDNEEPGDVDPADGNVQGETPDEDAELQGGTDVRRVLQDALDRVDDYDQVIVILSSTEKLTTIRDTNHSALSYIGLFEAAKAQMLAP